MKPKLNLFIRVLTIVAAFGALACAFLLKGKIDGALVSTKWATADAEVKAPLDFDGRIKALGALPTLLDAKRKSILELETSKKDLMADVADKKTKIEGLTAKTTELEGQVAEVTRKRDEATAALTDANSKKDGATAELATVKEELVAEKAKSAAMFTKEQVAQTEAKVTEAEEKATKISARYSNLFNFANKSGVETAQAGFASDPLAEPAKDDSGKVVSAEILTESVLTRVTAYDASSGMIAFSIGELGGISKGRRFAIKVGGKDIGQVQISEVQTALSFGQIQPDADLRALSAGDVVSLKPAVKKASN